jgi:steroid delta-isomerase-like uncharacterized protein
MADINFARRWAETRTTDLSAHRELYAGSEDFVIESQMVDDHLGDSISTDDEFDTQMSGNLNQDTSNGVGVQKLTVTETFEGSDHLFIHWDYAIEGASTYRGLPTNGASLTSKGSTFLRFNADGKIILESTFVNENPLLQQLGLPIITPHYWEEGFDPSSLG